MFTHFSRLLLLCLLAVAWLAAPLPAASAPAPASANHVGRGDATILIYHHFGDDRYPTTNVGMARFEEQMAWLAANDYRVIPLAELVAMLRESRPLPPKTVAITIDDGYRTIYSKAWPVLRRYGFPFAVFLYVEGLEKKYANYLTWEQVGEMAAAGVDFQDHGYSHHRLADWPKGMDEAAYRRWIREDLQRGAALLAARLGATPQLFAIPYGEYNHIVLEEARKLGYEGIFSQDAGSVSDDTAPWLITREPILGQEWATLEHFKMVLERVDLPLADYTPGLAPLSDPTPSRFGARLLHPERYRPGSFGIYVSELGWQPAKQEGDLVYIDNQATLTRRTNRVMISAREKESGRTAVRFWLLTMPATP